MIRSMMNLITLSLSFWDYTLETATCILNMVPTKKVLVKQDTPDKLRQRSVKCIFIRYPKEMMGYYFYFPPESKIVVASEIPMEVEGFEPPHEEEAPVRRFVRTHRVPERLCLNVEVEEHSLGDLNEPANYKAAMFKMDNIKHMQERLDLNKTQGATTPEEVKRMQNVPYASVVGSIMYAVRCTRPDFAFAQNITSHFQRNPAEPHWTAVKTILKYLGNTKDMFLAYGGNPEAEL
ncbi:hypothetical protein Tco_0526933 [Tanacetum coccineum]